MGKLTKKIIKELEDTLSYKFTDQSLLCISLTHKSFVNALKMDAEKDNEKFEFLGDAVLNLSISQLLMEWFPEMDEGMLSKKRSSLVNEKSLAKLARKIDLGPYIRLGKGEKMSEGHDKDSILADALEALIGGIYLDSDFNGAKGFIEHHFKNAIRYSARPGSYKDYKTLVQELSQKIHKKTPQYKLMNVKGPEHKKVFESEIRIGEESFGVGKGRSKKDSEQKCAKMALKKLEKK